MATVRELATSTMSEGAFAAHVEGLKTLPAAPEALSALLREEHPVYRERGTAATSRMRGWVLLALGEVGIRDGDQPLVLEELESGREPYLVAAAAAALRRGTKPKGVFAGYLLRALRNIRYHDDFVSLQRFGGFDAESDTTASAEIVASLAWLGRQAAPYRPELAAERAEATRAGMDDIAGELAALEALLPPTPEQESADCCGSLPRGLRLRPRRATPMDLSGAQFEDQDGRLVSFEEAFRGHTTVAAFFYTRCENPNKCSLTVSKLARLQRSLETANLADGVRIAAVTYDPQFDLPARLRAYGEARGLRFSGHARMFRAVRGWEALRAHFELGVNFIQSLVNRHRVELFVVNPRGEIACSFERLLWSEAEVLDAVREVASLSDVERTHEEPQRVAWRVPPARHLASNSVATAAAVLMAFFPKCPVCWAAYLSVFGVTTIARLPYSPWFATIFLSLIVLNLGALWVRCRSRQRMRGFFVALLGAGLLVTSRLLGLDGLGVAGAAATLVGSALSVLEGSRLTGRERPGTS